MTDNFPRAIMLRIRQEQMDALQAARDRPLIGWIAGQLRLEHAQALSEVVDGDLAGRVESGLARARKHGFTASAHLFRFVDALFRYGDDFDHDPDVAARLADPARHAAGRLDDAVAAAASKR